MSIADLMSTCFRVGYNVCLADLMRPPSTEYEHLFFEQPCWRSFLSSAWNPLTDFLWFNPRENCSWLSDSLTPRLPDSLSLGVIARTCATTPRWWGAKESGRFELQGVQQPQALSNPKGPEPMSPPWASPLSGSIVEGMRVGVLIPFGPPLGS